MVFNKTTLNDLISYTLKTSNHNIDSLSQILGIPAQRLLDFEAMTAKDLEILQKFQTILPNYLKGSL